MSLLPPEIYGKVFRFFLGEMLCECTRRATKLSDRKFNEPEKNITNYRHLQCGVYITVVRKDVLRISESHRISNGIDNETDDSLTLACFSLRARCKYSVYFCISFSLCIYFAFFTDPFIKHNVCNML